MFFFGFQELRGAMEKFGRIWNRPAFLDLLESRLRHHGASHAAVVVGEWRQIVAALGEAVTEYKEEE